VSIYGLFADPATIQDHLNLLSGVLPGGALEVIGEQVKRITAKGSGTLGFAFFSGLAISLWSANAGVKAVFDALNVYFNAGIDSVLALRPGSSRTVELDLYAAGNGISTYSVTLRFDPAVVHVLGATGTPGYMPDPTVTPGSGQVTIAATGSVPTYFSVIPLANVTFSVDAAATAGVLVQIDVNQMIGYFGGDFLSTTAGKSF